MNDESLRLFPCNPGDDTEFIWKELIPQIGVRMAFKKKWAVELEHDGDPSHVTPGGMDSLGMATPDTRDMDLEEADCEGNETKFDNSPVVPPIDGNAMAYADVALPAAPGDVVELQGSTVGAPGNSNESGDEDDEMYRPSVQRRQTRGSFRE